MRLPRFSSAMPAGLPPALEAHWVAVWRQANRFLAVSPAELVRAGSSTPTPVHVALKTVSATDADMVNAWGIGARIITIPADELAEAPAQFDQIRIADSVFTVDYVHEIRLGESLVAHKCYSRGQT